jgi:hypothetical protein
MHASQTDFDESNAYLMALVSRTQQIKLSPFRRGLIERNRSD